MIQSAFCILIQWSLYLLITPPGSVSIYIMIDKQSWLQLCYEPVYITRFSVYGFEHYFFKNEDNHLLSAWSLRNLLLYLNIIGTLIPTSECENVASVCELVHAWSQWQQAEWLRDTFLKRLLHLKWCHVCLSLPNICEKRRAKMSTWTLFKPLVAARFIHRACYCAVLLSVQPVVHLYVLLISHFGCCSIPEVLLALHGAGLWLCSCSTPCVGANKALEGPNLLIRLLSEDSQWFSPDFSCPCKTSACL